MKKAASEVIATTLLIMIVITIGAIIFIFSKSILEKQETQIPALGSYYDADLYILTDLATLAPGSGGASGNLLLGVRRIDNENGIVGARFMFADDNGNSYSYDDYSNPPNETGITKEYEITPIDVGITDFSGVRKVSLSLLYAKNKATRVLDEEPLE
jgi:hypothetical protein